MRPIKRQNNQPYGLEITDILDTDERCIVVMLKKTGGRAVIRRDLAEFHGQRMFVPGWLAEKLLKNHGGAV